MLRNWPRLTVDEHFINETVQKLGHYGVSLRTGALVGVDLDIREKQVTQAMKSWLDANVGPTLYRVGTMPKLMCLYRTKLGVAYRSSGKYKNFLDDHHEIEILSNNRQFTAFGVHPKTGRFYRWLNKRTPVDVPFDELPEITPEHIDGLFQFFHDTMPVDWEVVRKSEGFDPEHEHEYNGQPPDFSLDTLKKLLGYVSPEDYQTWVDCGMGLYHQFDGSVEARDVWVNWSAKASTFNRKECLSKWPTFEVNSLSGDPTTARTIAAYASSAGAVVPRPTGSDEDSTTVAAFLKRYVYITAGDQVCDLHLPPSKAIMKLNEFRNTVANQAEKITTKTAAGKEKTVICPTSKLWMTHPDRITARELTYQPKAPFLVEDSSGLARINQFHFPDHGDILDESRRETFDCHMGYLFPDPWERKWFVQWMAFNVQHPEKRCKVTPLHISRIHGTGRGWVVELMEALLGPWNCTNTSMSTLCGEGAGGVFKDYLHKSLFCSVEEVREGKKLHQVNDKIRDLLVSPRLEVNLKYGGKATIDVYTNFFWQTNHSAPLYLPKQDRRIQVLTGPQTLKSNQYYEKLYRWLEDEDNIHHLFNYLADLDLSDFNYQRSAATKGRENLVAGSLSEFEYAVEVIKTRLISEGVEALPLEEILAHVNTIHEGYVSDSALGVVVGIHFQAEPPRIINGKVQTLYAPRGE